MNTPGNKKSTKWLVVINADKEKSENCDILTQYQAAVLNDYTLAFVATIIHDKDKLVNGELKTPHAHFYIETENISKSKFLAYLSGLLRSRKEIISLEATNSDILGIQYLIHKNDPTKFQYDASLIKTNNSEKLSDRLNKSYVAPISKETQAREAILNSNTFIDLVNSIGINEASRYRTAFNQIKEEQRQDLKTVIDTNIQLFNAIETILNNYQSLITNVKGLKNADSLIKLDNHQDFIDRQFLYIDSLKK